MKDTLLREYKINAEVKEYNEFFGIFYIDYQKYIFLKVDRPDKDIEYIYNVTNNSKYHSIIKNVSGNLLTYYNKKNFVLLKLNHPEHDEILLTDILKFQINTTVTNKNLDRTSWSSLWEVKNDYLEYQISELGKNHKSAIKSFSYYIGLSENACFYFNNIPKDKILAFTQKRVFYPNTALNFLNPLNLVIDYRVRDLAEYIKNVFWNREDATSLLKRLISLNILSENEYKLLYARLLYPSNYFDALTEVLEKKKEDDYLLVYIERAEEYRIFLRDSYHLLRQVTPLLEIDWIIKEH